MERYFATADRISPAFETASLSEHHYPQALAAAQTAVDAFPEHPNLGGKVNAAKAKITLQKIQAAMASTSQGLLPNRVSNRPSFIHVITA